MLRFYVCVTMVACGSQTDETWVNERMLDDAQCTRSERNQLALVGAVQLLISNCLTSGGQRDRDEEVEACIPNVITGYMGISTLNSGCYSCLVNVVQLINHILPYSMRDACISDISSDACGAVSGGTDLSSFTQCTGGLNPYNPRVESYCTENNALRFVETSLYRKITEACIDRTNFVSSGSETLLDCISTTIVVSQSGGRDSIDLTGECLLCWYQLFAAMSVLPPYQRDACVIEPTASDCVTGEFHKDLFLFSKCSGIHPVATDTIYLTRALSNSASLAIPGLSLAAAFVMTVLLI